jgi:hypothetical protein
VHEADDNRAGACEDANRPHRRWAW